MDLGGAAAAAPVSAQGDQLSDSNISDVLQAIQAADPERALDEGAGGAGDMYGGGLVAAAGAASFPAPHALPHVAIVEQPASKALRFRYECEGRSAGSIPGASSTQDKKTFPAIEVVGYRGPAVVVVSCVTVDRPHRPHPHNLVGKDLCKDGVCTTKINPETMQVTFNNLGIQCVKKKDIEDALTLREKIRVDPFKTGFAHKKNTHGVDLNAVRLCFQVFVEKDGRFNRPLAPVVSDIIYDKKAMSDLTICRMSHASASVAGGAEVILLCEKVAKDDIAVRLYEMNQEDTAEVWSARADVLAVHKQVAIVFRTPRYHTMTSERSVHAYIQLLKPSDPTAQSERRAFELTPVEEILRKRPRFSSIEVPRVDMSFGSPSPARDHSAVKLEPREPSIQYEHQSPVHNLGSNLNMYRNVQPTPSPQYSVPTPSPPQLYQYAPVPGLGLAYSPQPAPYDTQQWNIPVEHQPMIGGGAGVAGMSEGMGWEAGAGAAAGCGEAAVTSGDFPSISNLLAADSSLRQLNNSDLECFLPESDVADSFSRLRTDASRNDPFHDKNML